MLCEPCWLPTLTQPFSSLGSHLMAWSILCSTHDNLLRAGYDVSCDKPSLTHLGINSGETSSSGSVVMTSTYQPNTYYLDAFQFFKPRFLLNHLTPLLHAGDKAPVNGNLSRVFRLSLIKPPSFSGFGRESLSYWFCAVFRNLMS
jgi:hypothetical protein